MRCKWCGEALKRSGDLWVPDLSLGDKNRVIRHNSWTLDEYRTHAIYCNFTAFDKDSKLHEPSESERVITILNQYGSKDRSGLGGPYRW